MRAAEETGGSAGVASSGRDGEAQALRRVEAIRAAMPEGGLFHELAWRASPDAFEISAAFAVELDKLGYRLAKFVQACNLLYRLSAEGRQPGWIAELLDRGKPAELVALQRERRFRDAMPRVLRPDVILTEEGYTIAELDNVPGGIGLTAWLGREYAKLGADVLGGPDGMLEGFASLLPDGGDILVSEEAGTYRPEMEWIAKQLNAECGMRNAESKIQNPHRWRVLDCEARADWQARVYRFFELFDLANLPGAPALIERMQAGEVEVTPPFKPALEEKLWFALFWLKPLEGFWIRELSERVFRELRKVIPYSWLVNPEPLPPHAVLPGLEVQSWKEVAAFSQKQRELILKVSGFSETAWGARGVVMAQDVPHEEWRRELEAALAAYGTQPHVLQRFHKGRLVEQRWWDEAAGVMRTMQGRVRLCPYYFPGEGRVKCAGALATICPADKKLLHGMSEAILAPTAVGAS